MHRPEVGNTAASLERDLAAIARAVAELSTTHERVLLLGGDNGLTYAAALGLSHSAPLGGLLYLDVHWDLRAYPPHSSGCSFRRLLDERVIAVERLRPIGIQRPADPARLARGRFDELERYARAAGIRAVGFDDAVRIGVARCAVDALAAWPAPRYLSIDLDAVDERELPGVSAPGSGRFPLCDVVAAAHAAAPYAAVADVVELAPALDPSGRSTRAAADVASAIIAAWSAA
ncbi:MAG: arginase family protein [Planctomycetota bacterium]